MGLWRRRRKTVLAAGAALAVVVVGAAEVARRRVAGYRPGERTEGVVDTLERELPEGAPRLVFTDRAEERGLVFRHFPGTRAGRLPEDMGSGVAVGDVDGDGWPDVLLVDAGPLDGPPGRSRLFRNLGGGRFEDVTEASGFELDGVGMGALFVDVDGDRDLDLFATAYGTCRLFENDGAGRFTDVSARAGLAQLEGFWSGVAAADHDRDGDVDLYVCGYVVYDEEGKGEGFASQFGVDIPVRINPSAFEPERNLLLVNRGDGTFEEGAAAAGVANATGRSLGALFCDLDDDGWPDLYVANDVSDNALFLNRGDGTFEDRTTVSLVGDYRGAMGLAAADFDRDRDLDLFITHWVGQENALYAARPGAGPAGGTPGEQGAVPQLYFDVSARVGLGHVALPMVGWATRFVDLDNDGGLDLFVVNGSTIPTADDPTQLTPQLSQVFWREPGRGWYHDLGSAAGTFFGERHVGRGGATLDVDLDGDEDLVVSLHGERARLLVNEGGNARPVLRLRLRQPEGNTLALGARVEASVGDAGDDVRLDLVGTQGSYLSQHAAGELAFGLGDAGWVRELVVRWPTDGPGGGVEERVGPLHAGTLVTWTRGAPPVVEALPGLPRERGPDVQRAFFAVRGEANRARLAEDWDAAVAGYGAALGLWPGHPDALYYLGHVEYARGDERAALAAWETLVAFEPGRSAGWMQIGMVRLPGGSPELDDLDAAGAAFARCHAINGEESRPVIQLGVVALLRGELDVAREHLSDAARLNPRSVEARYLGGRAAYLQGDRAAAEALLREASTLARETPRAGASLSNEGDTESGAAMVADTAVEDVLGRWRTLAEREPDVDAEYGG